MKAALAVLAVLYVLVRIHTTIWLYGAPIASVPVAELLLTATLAAGGACVALVVVARRRGWLQLVVAYDSRPVIPGGASS